MKDGWNKSSFSNGNGGNNCVEVAPVKEGLSNTVVGVGVQNSKTRDAMLFFTPDEWRAFIAGAKAGEFDL